jgi:cytochrome c-type biogenesis protein CcmF
MFVTKIMLHTNIGNIGHLSLIVSFVTSLLATYSYYKSIKVTDLQEVESWKKFARYAFYTHGLSIIGVIACLFTIIYNQYFEYHYAWTHSSKQLPVYYIISCFWEGQEGSFLLWIFWNVILGIILIKTNKTWESPLMVVFAAVQTFLCSMIIGVVIPWANIKIGSSPFLLMREVMPDIPIFATNPNFVAEDGRGLNPLLQNYWMVIHPPTLFLGFATTLIPFAYALAGLWTKQYKEWIRPALPWALVSALILGVGIIMGGYWAYETLNFGGYWNWDPVENASFVPWLTLVAAIHCMIIYKNNETALRTSYILVIVTFVLVLYSTFLNRSGILGDVSVHSFTDLGLSGQLLLYLFFFLIVAVALLVYNWKNIPTDDKEVSTYSREFWVFMGATTLCLSAFQIIAVTSLPVYNTVAQNLGFVSKLAPPADAATYYSKFQLWFGVGIAIFSGVGQTFWWKKVKQETLSKYLLTPALIALVTTALIVLLSVKTNIAEIYNNFFYILLLFACIFSLVTNGSILGNIIRGNYKLSGGAVTHIGIAMMLIGILYSSGYTKVISMNMTGFGMRGEDFTKDGNKENKENLMLWLGQSQQMKDYMLTYKGKRLEIRGVKGYFDRKDFDIIENDFHAVALKDIESGGKKIASVGDTVITQSENTYYEIEFREPSGKVFSLYPRWQNNAKMGTAVSPDLVRAMRSDIYTYVSYDPITAAGGEKEWKKTQMETMAMGDTIFLNDFVAVLENVVRITDLKSTKLTEADAAVQAKIKVIGKDFKTYELNPIFAIKGAEIATPVIENDETGIRIRFTNIDPKTGKFTFAVNTSQPDMIVLKALEKPLINVLWLGTLILIIGFTMAIFRRYREFKLMRNKELA